MESESHPKRSSVRHKVNEQDKVAPSDGRIYRKNSVKVVLNEKKILESLKNSFIVNMHYAFQDETNLYLVLDYQNGGDLRYHMSRNRTFSELQISRSPSRRVRRWLSARRP